MLIMCYTLLNKNIVKQVYLYSSSGLCCELIVPFVVKLAAFVGLPTTKKEPKLLFCLTTFTIPTIQAGHTAIHQNTRFGVTFFTKLCAFWVAFVVHTIT